MYEKGDSLTRTFEKYLLCINEEEVRSEIHVW